MSLRKMPDIKVEASRLALAALAQRSIESFRAPRVMSKVLVDQLDVPRTALDRFLTDKMFELDADEHRQGDKARLFSPRDTLRLTAAALFSQVGLPRSISKEIAESIARYCENSQREVQASFPNVEVVVFKALGGWQVVMKRWLKGQPIDSSVLRDGKWVKPSQPVEFPPARVVVDVDELVRRTMAACGIMFVRGDRHAIERALKEMS